MGNDIFGMAFMDYLAGNKFESIVVYNNLGETTYIPVVYFFRNFRMMPEGEQKVMKACKGSVLDVGSGAGSHALYLQEAGCDVMAIDLSEGATEVMRKRGVNKVQCIDFFDFEGAKFDNILFLMNGAGIARTIDGLYELFYHAKNLLNNNGSIFIESTDIIYMFEDEDGSYFINLGAEYYGEVVYKLQYGKTYGNSFRWLFVDRDNMIDIAEKTGLNPQIFYDSAGGGFIMRLTIKTQNSKEVK